MGLTVRPTCPYSTKVTCALERWCDVLCPRAEKTLHSSLNTPTSAALLSSEALNVLTVPAPCTAESVSDNEGECDGEEDGGEEDDEYSDNDSEIVFEQSGTADSTDTVSGGTEAPAKKAKITLTEEEENFAKKFRPMRPKSIKSGKSPYDTSHAGVPPLKSKERDSMM